MGVPNADLYYIEQKLVFNNYHTYFEAELRMEHFGLLLTSSVRKSQVVVFKASEIRTVHSHVWVVAARFLKALIPVLAALRK